MSSTSQVSAAGNAAETAPLPCFGTIEYWDEDYLNEEEETYDWLLEGDVCIELITQALRRLALDRDSPTSADPEHGGEARSGGPRILHVGSGNSLIPELLFAKGYTNQIATDASGVCVGRMRKRYEEKGIFKDSGMATGQASAADPDSAPGIDFCFADCTNLHQFSDGSLDVVFEKGCMDAMFCDDGPHAVKIFQYISEVHRVLAENGAFVAISYHPLKQVDGYLKLPCFGFVCTVRWVEEGKKLGPEDEEGRNPEVEQQEQPAPTSGVDEGGGPPRRRNFNFVFVCRKQAGLYGQALTPAQEVLQKIQDLGGDQDPPRSMLREMRPGENF